MKRKVWLLCKQEKRCRKEGSRYLGLGRQMGDIWRAVPRVHVLIDIAYLRYLEEGKTSVRPIWMGYRPHSVASRHEQRPVNRRRATR